MEGHLQPMKIKSMPKHSQIVLPESGDTTPWNVGAVSAHYPQHKIIWRGTVMLSLPFDSEVIPVGPKYETTHIAQCRPWTDSKRGRESKSRSVKRRQHQVHPEREPK